MTLLVLVLMAIATTYVGTIAAAFSALMRLSLRLTVERNGRAAGLGPYLDDPVLLFVPLRLLLGLIIAVTAIFLATLTGVDDVKDPGVLLLSMAGFFLVFEHLLPLLIVRRNPERVLIRLLPTFKLFERILKPITLSLVGLIATLRPVRREPGTDTEHAAGESPSEPDHAAHAYLEAGEQEGLIEREERRLLESIVDFGDTLVREVMTPRPDIVAVPIETTLAELRQLFAEQQYSRVPVYKDTLDQIQGFVFIKDLVRLPDGNPSEQVVPRLLRPAFFVPETKRVSELLKEFQRQQQQIAVVVDEYGGTAGLVTLEDLIEEIVGEIRDEYDVETESVQEEGNGSFVFSGRAGIDELEERLGVEIKSDGFDTVGGYLVTTLGRVPAAGESFEVDGLHIEVLDVERRRVGHIRVRRSQPAPQATGEAV
ncbi:MAG TPA: hemolysin family protein [Vicinamibacterales bacterium]